MLEVVARGVSGLDKTDELIRELSMSPNVAPSCH